MYGQRSVLDQLNLAIIRVNWEHRCCMRTLLQDVSDNKTRNIIDKKICRVIDFSIHGMSTENLLRSQRASTPYKIKINNYKLIDLVKMYKLGGELNSVVC